MFSEKDELKQYLSASSALGLALWDRVHRDIGPRILRPSHISGSLTTPIAEIDLSGRLPRTVNRRESIYRNGVIIVTSPEVPRLDRDNTSLPKPQSESFPFSSTITPRETPSHPTQLDVIAQDQTANYQDTPPP